MCIDTAIIHLSYPFLNCPPKAVTTFFSELTYKWTKLFMTLSYFTSYLFTYVVLLNLRLWLTHF